MGLLQQHWKIWIIFKAIMLSKRSQIQSVHTLLFHLYETLEKSSVVHNDRVRKVVSWGWVVSMLGLNCVPPLQRYAEVLTPSSHAYDLTWKWYLCRCNQIKMRSYSSRVRPRPIGLASLKEEKTEIYEGECHVKTQRHRGKIALERWRHRLVLCCHKPKSAWGYQNLVVARKDLPLEVLKRAWPWQYLDCTYTLQNSKRIHGSCLKPPAVVLCYRSLWNEYRLDCLKWSTGIFLLFSFF